MNGKTNHVLDGHVLTKGLSRKQIDTLSFYLEREEYRPGASIMEEHKIYGCIFFIEKGTVSIIKTELKTGYEFSIAKLREKEYFGEMSFLTENDPASASVRANETTVVWILRKEAIENLPLYQQLVINIAQGQMGRMRSTTEKYVKSLSEQLAQAKVSKDFGMLFIMTIILFALQPFVKTHAEATPPERILYSWGFLILYLLPFAYLLWRMKYPLRTYGVTTKGWKKSAVEGLVTTAVVSPIFILFTHFTKPGEPLFSFTHFQDYSTPLVVIYFIFYIFSSYIQEFIARGVIQGSLQRFMYESHFTVPIFVAAMVFGVCHLHKGLELALFTFVLSFILGFLYYRHQTLIGVTITHYFLGFLAEAMGYL